jgi:hypothetical protein
VAAIVSRPPGPKNPPIIGNLVAFRSDPLGFLTRAARAYGDLVYFRVVHRLGLLGVIAYALASVWAAARIFPIGILSQGKTPKIRITNKCPWIGVRMPAPLTAIQ